MSHHSMDSSEGDVALGSSAAWIAEAAPSARANTIQSVNSSDASTIANRRYSRLPIGATSVRGATTSVVLYSFMIKAGRSLQTEQIELLLSVGADLIGDPEISVGVKCVRR